MKFTFNWLKQYVDVAWSPAELAERLTFAGIEVEEIRPLGGQIPEQVVIAQILSSEKHPNADKLSVCRVHDGTGERQIVCGARNYKVGDKVPLALPGSTLAGGITIRVAKLRGVESQGMMCSPAELGLSQDSEGLLILPPDAPLGKKFAEYMGRGDTLFDIEVTPNRPDWLSVIGIAREVAALTSQPLRLPQVTLADTGSLNISVTVEAPDLCPRYTARLIRGVKIGPSPAWLKSLLETVGMRAINNVVDVTNFVLLECGAPLHAFDFNLLRGQRIAVRRAKDGELFEAIDGSRHELTSEMLVIADAERVVALAGIMGGKNTEINDATTDVLLEAAYFHPPTIRRTSKKLGLASDSSYRFERGTDIEGLGWASARAAALIHELAGGQVVAGMVDVLAKPIQRRRVTCRYAQVNRLLGIQVPSATVKRIFDGLGLTVTKDDDNACEVEVPGFRVDVEREADLIEEVCRIYGVEQIPAHRSPAVAQVSEFDARWDALTRLRQALTALGFDEAVNQTMVAQPASTTTDQPVLTLQNPLTADQRVLRASLLPGLVQNVRTNVARHQYDVRLFEIGRVFGSEGRERLRLALVMTGRRTPGDWQRTEKVDYFDLKGVLEELGLTASIQHIPAAQARKMDLRDDVFLAELDLDAVLATPPTVPAYRELPKYPAIERDVALIVDERVTHEQILQVFAQIRNKHLERVALFDIFRGGPIPTGKKSMAYALTFRAMDRTLTDAEVNAAHQEIKRQLQQALGCTIRE